LSKSKIKDVISTEEKFLDFIQSLKGTNDNFIVPENSVEIYKKILEGLCQEEHRLKIMSDQLSNHSYDYDKRAQISSRRSYVLMQMADLEKHREMFFKANVNIDMVIFSVFKAIQGNLQSIFEDMGLDSKFVVDFLNKYKEKSADLRDKIDDLMLEIPDEIKSVTVKSASDT